MSIKFEGWVKVFTSAQRAGLRKLLAKPYLSIIKRFGPIETMMPLGWGTKMHGKKIFH